MCIVMSIYTYTYIYMAASHKLCWPLRFFISRPLGGQDQLPLVADCRGRSAERCNLGG